MYGMKAARLCLPCGFERRNGKLSRIIYFQNRRTFKEVEVFLTPGESKPRKDPCGGQRLLNNPTRRQRRM